jgi:hypothetical protein
MLYVPFFNRHVFEKLKDYTFGMLSITSTDVSKFKISPCLCLKDEFCLMVIALSTTIQEQDHSN